MTTLIGIPSNMLTDAWPSVEPLIVKACAGSNGRFLPGDIARAIASRDFQLWAADEDGNHRAIALTRLVKYPQLLACETMATVGDGMADWKHHLFGIETWAKTQGAAQSHVIARPGWGRVLKSHGYDATHWILEKNL